MLKAPAEWTSKPHTSSVSRRRRKHDSIIQNACTECRKSRQRCDGQRPCSRCARKRRLICQYTASGHVRKEVMRAEINELRNYRQHSEHIIGLLASSNQSKFILKQIRSGIPLEEISTSLRSDINFKDEGKDLQLWGLMGLQGSDDGNSNVCSWWTEVTLDDAFIQHLLSLYFCCEYPVFASFSKKHFLEDFNKRRRKYCSSLLVNALLALACKFSDRPEARAHYSDVDTAGIRLYAEAKRLLALEQGHPSLTTIQAIGLMSIQEASYGRHDRGWFYAKRCIFMAIEMGLHVQVNSDEIPAAEYEVRSATLWGAFTLDQVWSLIVGRIPQASLNSVCILKPVIIDVDEQSAWIPYTDDGIQLGTNLSQPSNVRSAYRGFCELSKDVHQALYVLYAPVGPLSSQDILNIYTKYLAWYSSLPNTLRLGENSTPAVFFVLIYYHFAILLLFRPFIRLRFLGSSISPREVCVEAADAIASLVHSYRRLHSLRRTPSFLTYIVLTSAIIQLTVASTNTINIQPPMKAIQACDYLRDMSTCHSFAGRALQFLRNMTQNWSTAASITTMIASADDSTDACEPSIHSMLVREHIPPFRHGFTDSLFLASSTQIPPTLTVEGQLERNGFELI